MRLSTLLLVFFLGIFMSCDESNGSSKPRFSGASGEMILVIDKKYWEGELGTKIKETFGQEQFGLPQDEPIFKLLKFDHKRFTRNLKTHRNTVIFEITKDGTEGLDLRKDAYARGQILAWYKAPNEKALVRLLKETQQQVIHAFQKKEISRMISRNKAFGPKQLRAELMKNHQLSMTLQKDIEVKSDQDGFVWLALERERPLGGFQHQISQGILIYYYDYADTSAFDSENLLLMRDSICKSYVNGPIDGSYMTTDLVNVPPVDKALDFKGSYAKEIRGLWRMEGAFMGGPFISFSTVDQKRNRMVTVEGYVFAPQFNKREYVREVEAMVKSLKFAD